MQFTMSNFKFSIQQSPELEALIMRHAKVIHLPAKTVFCNIGDPLEGVYYIAEGRTSHYIVSPEGTEKMLYTLSRGWFFGETACTLGHTSSLISKTNTETTLYLLSVDDYQKLMGESILFRQALMTSNALKTLTMRHEIENITFYSCKDRLTKLFLTTVDKSRRIDGCWYGLHVRYTHADLSVIIGSSRITITKMINELCEDGVIRLVNRKIQVHADYYERHKQLYDTSE